ncbi:MAG TPA: hypothetical protein VFH06_03440 [Candidatus Saccharimonadales bacterium]|nr:hypothetical protein [Candidatus Saccharimonadales bacterium]
MALFIRQSEDRSKLQERLAAELQEKAKAKALAENEPKDIEDSAYLKDTKKTTSLAWAWVVIGLLAAIVVVMLFLQTAR